MEFKLGMPVIIILYAHALFDNLDLDAIYKATVGWQRQKFIIDLSQQASNKH